MLVDVVSVPSHLEPRHLDDRVVVVLDVLRATTTMASAFATGVKEIFVYPDIESVRRAKKSMPAALTCGEQNCLRPEGFDLGNSPDAFGQAHIGQTLLMCTTNGTKAILAARGAHRIFTSAMVNARSTAKAVQKIGKDVTLLGAGTNGELAMEDMIGAGMLALYLEGTELSGEAQMARNLFMAYENELPRVLRLTPGGRNVINANLEKDVDFAARQNIFTAVGEVKQGDPIRIVRAAW